MEFQIVRHETHYEIVVTGDVPDVIEGIDPYHEIPDGTRVLQDSTGFRGAQSPSSRWEEGAKQAVARGLKVAIVVHRALIFGLYRKALLQAMVDEELQIAVFTYRDEALAWLLSELPASEFRGRRRD